MIEDYSKIITILKNLIGDANTHNDDGEKAEIDGTIYWQATAEELVEALEADGWEPPQ